MRALLRRAAPITTQHHSPPSTTHRPGTVRATEHLLHQRVEKHMAMEERATKLQAERLALIEDRSRRAKALALQRAAVQDQFKRYART